MNKETTLWVKNISTADVNISDLGVKVPKKKSVNIFKSNPYLTEEKVKHSLENGALSKRIASGVLVVVSGPANEKPTRLKKVKQSDKPLTIKKTKTSVVIEPNHPELNESPAREGFGFADYGLGDLGPDVLQRREGAAVVVATKQEDVKEETSTVETKPLVTQNAISKQSAITMEAQQKVISHPMGKVAQPSNNPDTSQPFVIYRPSESEAKIESEKIMPFVDNKVITPQRGKRANERDLDVIQALNKKAEELNINVEDLPENVVIEIEAKIIGDKIIKDEAKGKFDSKVATKTDKGMTTVMKLKEVSKTSK